ncbi:MAG: hypothetical protein ACE5GK_06950 [Nitrospiria bacterium]
MPLIPGIPSLKDPRLSLESRPLPSDAISSLAGPSSPLESMLSDEVISSDEIMSSEIPGALSPVIVSRDDDLGAVEVPPSLVTPAEPLTGAIFFEHPVKTNEASAIVIITANPFNRKKRFTI